jgi:hypothetical protein
VVLAEEYAVAEEGEACASVHLPLDQLGLGVHPCGASIGEWLGEGSARGMAVELQLLSEITQLGYTGSQNLLYRYITQRRVESERTGTAVSSSRRRRR